MKDSKHLYKIIMMSLMKIRFSDSNNFLSCLRLNFQKNIRILRDILEKFIVLFDMSVNNIYTI